MGAQDILVLGCVLLLGVLAVVWILRRRRKGKGTCSAGCAGCAKAKTCAEAGKKR